MKADPACFPGLDGSGFGTTLFAQPSTRSRPQSVHTSCITPFDLDSSLLLVLSGSWSLVSSLRRRDTRLFTVPRILSLFLNLLTLVLYVLKKTPHCSEVPPVFVIPITLVELTQLN